MKYSERLGNITKQQLQKALDEFNLGEFSEASSITEGLFGQNLFLKSTKGSYVLRGCPHYDWQFKAEKYFADNLHKYTKTPVPIPYMVSTNKEIFGWEFIIMPKLEGISISSKLNEKDLTEKDRIGIAQAQGKMLVEMGKFKGSVCGYYDLELDNIKPLNMSYPDRIYKNIKNRLHKSHELDVNITMKSDLSEVDKLLLSSRSAMEMEFTPTYVMQDYKPENMLVDKVDGKWEVTGVFDLMEGYMGNGESDISRLYATYIDNERKDLADAFVEEYILGTGVERDSFKKRFPVFMLHDRSIIWTWRVKNKSVNDDMKNGFMNWVSKYLVL